jgi:hypothetical protein
MRFTAVMQPQVVTAPVRAGTVDGCGQPRANISYLPVTDAEPAVVSLARRPGLTSPTFESFVSAAREVAAASKPEHTKKT